MPSRPLLVAVAAVLLAGSAPAPLPMPMPVPAPAATQADDSPVRCQTGQLGDIVTTASRRPSVRAAPFAPGAPPPPPPPPMVSPAPVSGYATALQSRQRSVTARYAPVPENRERYADNPVAPVQAVADAPVSTFSVDVDTASYANVRRMLNHGQRPPTDAVRTEEMINYFRYDYPRPADRTQPFSITTDVTTTPWNPATRLLRIGLRGYDVTAAERPAANLVFLVDTSGSMMEPDKLPLVKAALSMLADQLTPRDTVSIVAYAGSAGLVLAPTHDGRFVKAALNCLEAGGSTAGGAGLRLAYDMARVYFAKGGINRIFLATDGDFNVGTTSDKGLEELVKNERDDGITLTTLGFGQGNTNDAMMERIADVGNGNYAYIDTATEAKKVLDDELSATLVTIAKDVKVQVEFNPAAVSQYRLIGYEDRHLNEQDFANDKVDAGDIGAGHQVTALYEVVPAGAKGWLPPRRYAGNRPAPGSADAREFADVRLRYKLPGGDTSRLIDRPVATALLASAAAPTGDSAFVAAVAAYGQRLRGDANLGGFGFADARRLAGAQGNYTRQEFLTLTELAETTGAPGAGGQ